MGTRSDYYLGRGKEAKWLGSKAYDGHPQNLKPEILNAPDEETFAREVTAFLRQCDDATLPEQGWPWPWEDSRTTDYAYAFDGGRVWGSYFGHSWRLAPEEPENSYEGEKMTDFPDMSALKNVTLGRRSGLLIFRVRG